MSWPARSCHQLSVCMGDSPQAATMIRKRKTASSLSKVANPNYSNTIQTVLRYLTGWPSFRAGLNSHAFAALSIIDARIVDRCPRSCTDCTVPSSAMIEIDPGERVRIYAAWQLSRQLRPHADRRRDARRAGRVNRCRPACSRRSGRGAVQCCGPMAASMPRRPRERCRFASERPSTAIGRRCRERVLPVGQVSGEDSRSNTVTTGV